MKKRVIPSWFGLISEEEIQAATESTKAFETLVINYQRRPIPQSNNDNTNNTITTK